MSFRILFLTLFLTPFAVPPTAVHAQRWQQERSVCSPESCVPSSDSCGRVIHFCQPNGEPCDQFCVPTGIPSVFSPPKYYQTYLAMVTIPSVNECPVTKIMAIPTSGGGSVCLFLVRPCGMQFSWMVYVPCSTPVCRCTSTTTCGECSTAASTALGADDLGTKNILTDQFPGGATSQRTMRVNRALAKIKIRLPLADTDATKWDVDQAAKVRFIDYSEEAGTGRFFALYEVVLPEDPESGLSTVLDRTRYFGVRLETAPLKSKPSQHPLYRLKDNGNNSPQEAFIDAPVNHGTETIKKAFHVIGLT